ncbi:MAG: hypothetical protein ACRDPW_00010 [Mycobacteriales bacterium]
MKLSGIGRGIRWRSLHLSSTMWIPPCCPDKITAADGREQLRAIGLNV